MGARLEANDRVATIPEPIRTNQSMSGNREIKGFWWVPEHSESRWFGTLTLEPDQSPKLELIIERQGWTDPIPPQPGRVIHGVNEHGKPVTLLFLGKPSEQLNGVILRRTFLAGHALIGTHLPTADCFAAQSIWFKTHCLYSWLNRSGFDRGTTRTARSLSIRYDQPDDEWFSVSSDLELGIHTTYTTNSGFQEERIREDAAVTFRSKSDLSFARCRKLIGRMRALLHFASLEPVYPVCIAAQLRQTRGEQAPDSTFQSVEVWNGGLRRAEEAFRQPEQWTFRYEDVRGDFGGFIRQWLEFTDKYEEALGSYACTVYHPLTWELQHLSLTQALDAYHGVKFNSHHEQDFRAKLEALIKLHSLALNGLIDDETDFADRVICTRNYYTHHNPKWLMKGKVAKDIELFRMNEKLRLLFQACVLADLNIPADRFHRLRRQLATEIVSYE